MIRRPLDLTADQVRAIIARRLPRNCTLEIPVAASLAASGAAVLEVPCLPDELLCVREPWFYVKARWGRTIYEAGPQDGPPPECWEPAATLPDNASRLTLLVNRVSLVVVEGGLVSRVEGRMHRHNAAWWSR